MSGIWLKAEYEFASLFSYRIPNFSPAYAPSSPMPGPSAFKLALVATRIEQTGNIDAGEAIFDAVKAADIALQPADCFTTNKILVRRLKRMKDKSIGRSFGIREYIAFGSSITVFIQVDASNAAIVLAVMQRLRRIGTSDSLLTCIASEQEEPNNLLVARPLDKIESFVDFQDFAKRPVVPLLDIKPRAKFMQASPYSGSGGSFTYQRMYLFPLSLENQGENWRQFKRVPFEQ